MRDQYDTLFEDDVLDVRELMNSSDSLGLTGMEWNPEGGFIETRHVVATEPWRPSLVRRGERPRVQPASITRRCEHCAEVYKAARSSSRYCGATCRQAAGRAAR